MRKQLVCPRCGTPKKILRCGILRCPKCTRLWNRENYHKSAKRREQQRAWTIERKYGVPMSYLENLFERQNRACAICGRDWTQCVRAKHSKYDNVFLQRLYVDHCHATGAVRGLLCSKCNLAIGMLDEDLDRFDAAKQYLIRARGGGFSTAAPARR